MKITITVECKSLTELQEVLNLDRLVTEDIVADSTAAPTTQATPILTHDSIDALDFSVRTRNALTAESIFRISTLVRWNEYMLMKIPNLGRKSLREIHEVLASQGHALNTKPGYHTPVRDTGETGDLP